MSNNNKKILKAVFLVILWDMCGGVFFVWFGVFGQGEWVGFNLQNYLSQNLFLLAVL